VTGTPPVGTVAPGPAGTGANGLGTVGSGSSSTTTPTGTLNPNSALGGTNQVPSTTTTNPSLNIDSSVRPDGSVGMGR
jgi:hypothetical protein